jgi:hypothetical protein
MIDYAYPTMMAEKALKDLHNAMLDKKYAEALKLAMDAAMQIKDIQFAVVHEMEQEKYKEIKFRLRG